MVRRTGDGRPQSCVCGRQKSSRGSCRGIVRVGACDLGRGAWVSYDMRGTDAPGGFCFVWWWWCRTRPLSGGALFLTWDASTVWERDVRSAVLKSAATMAMLLQFTHVFTPHVEVYFFWSITFKRGHLCAQGRDKSHQLRLGTTPPARFGGAMRRCDVNPHPGPV